ncbi:hypothetical protein ASPNIDRAFT_39012 [Aspergillus niger ATCC 1015]|uniref:Uncharacterized protein n=2 Tax=Aspergillus niger TaxID=5061 RepID=G3YCQ9_ASPNA|nr:hypothetical protein ASPNIDRAFT_39012 [Aspergillus niger ATCC 1015]KAI2998702.1 hypothetical protein CBS147345_9219 [Aspergillus niger]TPR04558.1 hypothetical protein CAN33_0030335 [Aspergillus niger]SPB51410.1 unnamed protein product [Aspergillus niger]
MVSHPPSPVRPSEESNRSLERSLRGPDSDREYPRSDSRESYTNQRNPSPDYGSSKKYLLREVEGPPELHGPATKKSTAPSGLLSWGWEIGASVLSVACVVILIVLLNHLDGMSYADWEYRVSPNAVVAVVATANRATLLFPVGVCLSQLKWNHYRSQRRLYDIYALDQASQGIWGSLQLITTKRPSLATLGAVTLIFSAALDPLTQQILTFPSRIVPALNETASLQTAQAYVPGNANSDNNMSLLILQSIYGSDNTQEPTCSTGSCKYPTFDTLGACSKCQDVTTGSKQSCTALSTNSSYANFFDGTAYQGAKPNCTYTTPGDLQITPDIFEAATVNIGSENAVELEKDTWTFATTDMDRLNLSSSQGPRVAGILNPIVGLAAAIYDDPYIIYTAENHTVLEPKPQITECALYFCAQRYTNNSYSSDHRSLAASETEQLYTKNKYFQMFYPNELAPLNSSTPSFATNGSYTISGNTVLQILNSFTSTVSLSDQIEAGWTYSVQEGKGTSPVMKNVAVGITKGIRAGPNSTTITGEAFTTQTYISVRWYWAVAPIVITILSILFLVLIVAHTARAKGVGLWKSSALALLACRVTQGPEHPDLQTLGEAEMEKVSKCMYVSWDREGEPLALRVDAVKKG